ncbi:MAG: MobA/MobL family protein [Chloroflexota bacterium]|nr:MobA/MobL family protein [Chloroflexota bacterium]
MALYHLSAQVIGRSSGRSSAAAAAYRSGSKLHDERTDLYHGYSRRRGQFNSPLSAAGAQGRLRALAWAEVSSVSSRSASTTCP